MSWLSELLPPEWVRILGLTQTWMLGLVALSLLAKSGYHRRKFKRWVSPSMDDIVELVAYYAGLYGTKPTFVKAFGKDEPADQAFFIGAAASLLAFVSIRGIYRTISRPEVTPTRNDGSGTGGTGAGAGGTGAGSGGSGTGAGGAPPDSSVPPAVQPPP